MDPPSQSTLSPRRRNVGVIVVAIQWLIVLVGPRLTSGDATAIVALGALGGGFATLLWWLLHGRDARAPRLIVLTIGVVAMLITWRLVHPSIRAGAMGFQYFIFALPLLCLALVSWTWMTAQLEFRIRWATGLGALLLVSGLLLAIRSEGVTGDGRAELAWRWASVHTVERSPSAIDTAASKSRAEDVVVLEGSWPGFRGGHRDAVVGGTNIATEWNTNPPVELWRRSIGSGWSSVAVHGDRLYTQEQRGKHEMVACYRTSDGSPIWTHQDTARFWQAESGAGPLATPTIHDGTVYTLGATGILNALNTFDGSMRWSRDVTSDTQAELPHWGFSSSPLVAKGQVIVHAGRLAAFDLVTGAPQWLGPALGDSHSSPHHMTLDGVEQVVMLSGHEVIGIAAERGTVLWRHPWPGSSIVQPAIIREDHQSTDWIAARISAAGRATGLQRLTTRQSATGWTVESRWASTRMKPHASDFVIHKGHVYGFDGRILTCLDAETGERRWKGGRYGAGQLLLLADQDLLLVISEQGQLALVNATPSGSIEHARMQAIDGKTWNHLTLVDDVLFVRNSREMAAFRLPARSLPG